MTCIHIVFLIDETFEESKKEMYQYETLDGNNSRVALQALSNEENSHPAFRTMLVSVYSGLSDDEAVRLAAKHNRTSFYHAMSTWDKVKKYRSFFIANGHNECQFSFFR